MQIREARQYDIPGIARVGVDTWRNTYRGIMADEYLGDLSYGRSEESWRTRLAEPDCFTYVAETDAREIIGYAFGGLERDGDPVYRGEVYALYVRAHQQRSGIGRLLVQACAKRLAGEGISTLLIWVLAANPSRGFYERLGGRQLRSKTISIGGRELEEVAYG